MVSVKKNFDITPDLKTSYLVTSPVHLTCSLKEQKMLEPVINKAEERAHSYSPKSPGNYKNKSIKNGRWV